MSDHIGLSSCCLSGAVHDGTPSGHVETIDGLQTYVAEPENKSKAKSIVFLPDVFGWEFPNVRLLADEYASAGFYTYVPDTASGDSIPHEFLQKVEPSLKTQEMLSITEKARDSAIVTATLAAWMPKHVDAVTLPLINGFINAVRTTQGTDKIGAIGFCWGGRYAILQAHGPSIDGEGNSVGGVDAAYACHPSWLSVPGDIEQVKKPLSIAIGDKDGLVDLDTIGKIKDVLDAKADVPHEIQIYKDQIHGFTLRSDWSSEKDKKAMDDAEKQGIAWFEKYLS